MEIPSVRILVVGDSGAGKTTLLKKLCNVSEDVMAHPHHWTTGCEQHVLMHTHTNQRGEHFNYFIEFVDVSGHPTYKQSRKVFYHGVHGIILVQDLSNTKSYRHLRDWLREIASEQQTNGGVVAATYSQHANDKSLFAAMPKLILANKKDRIGAPTKRPATYNDLPQKILESMAVPSLSIDLHGFSQYLNQVIEFAGQIASYTPKAVSLRCDSTLLDSNATNQTISRRTASAFKNSWW